MMRQYKVGVIGYGAIGKVVIQALEHSHDTAVLPVAILVRDIAKYKSEESKFHDVDIVITDDVDAFYDKCPDLVVEVAGQNAVSQYGIRALKSGADFMVSSIGAFTDDDLFQKMTHLAEENSGNLYLVAGALPGVDWMHGASIADVYGVKITQTKPVKSWLGTPAEDMVDLQSVKAPECFFTGTAREAAGIFRKSSNITAMLALVTVGMDRVQVSLVADPTAARMQTLVEFTGEAGDLSIEWKGVPSLLNPSTSKDVALNVIKAIKNICSSVKLGV